MKALSNTSIAAIFAVGLTLLVGFLGNLQFFHDKETQTTDEMMLLRYQIHKKYAPLKTDPHLVVAAIDQRSLQDFGRWPFNRSVHGDFLLLLSQEPPRTVGWDIFFTERQAKPDAGAVAPPPTVPTSTVTTPAPAASEPAPQAPTPAPAPAPTTTAPEAQPTQATPPAPSAENTNAAPSTPAAAAPSASLGIFSHPIGAGPADNVSQPTPPATAPTQDASAAPAAGTPPAPVAPASAPAPATPSSLNDDDQHFVDAASQCLNMVTAAEKSDSPQVQMSDNLATDQNSEVAPLTPKDFAPTQPFTHVTGDITKLLSSKWAILPFPELRKHTYFGLVNENGESGGGSRRTDPLVLNINGMVLPSFDLQVLMRYWGISADQVVITLGHDVTLPGPNGAQIHIPIDEKGQLILNYRALLDDFQVKSFSQISEGLYGEAQGEKSKARDALPKLKDSLLIIGVTFNGTDAGPTPLNNNTPLMVTHLTAIDNILQQDFVRAVSPWVWMPIYALFLFGAGSLMLRVGIAPMIPIAILAGIIVAVVGFATLYFGNLILPVAMPEIGILLLAGAVPTKRFFGEEREKLRVRKAMGAYLSDRVMNKILAHPDGLKLGGVKQVITIMFCDIRGFTAYCDNRDPQEVLNVVNEYFEEMTQVVFKYEGTVDKYIGDCIMAFWNAPDDQPDHAQRAVCCAMEMRYALANFKVKRAGLDTELFECGIGIHTGEALVGNMGSTLKVNYTAMGSTVNLGARLESLTKKLNERILISKATLDELTGDFPITDRGEAIVPGFANPIHVFGVGAEQDLGSAIKVGMKLAKKQDYTAEEVTKPIWAPAPLPEDADPNP